jgi:hypothetical protein
MGGPGNGRAKGRALLMLLALSAATALTASAAGRAGADARPPVLKAGNPSGIVFAREARPRGGGGNPDLAYHGGAVMTSPASATAIFWGSSWGNGSAGDKITGIDSFYNGVGGTRYLGTTTEYTDGTGRVSDGLSYDGHAFDGAAASSKAPSTSTVLSVVAATLSAGGGTPEANGYYAVYSDQPRGHANYCAWHSWGTIDGTLVQFAFFFDLDGDRGCDPQDVYSEGHSQGLTALANVSGHELSETVTDRHGDAWYDSSGAENADKCAWTFGASAIVFSNRTSWKIQGNWSNAVYNAGGGSSYDHTGCIDGN